MENSFSFALQQLGISLFRWDSSTDKSFYSDTLIKKFGELEKEEEDLFTYFSRVIHEDDLAKFFKIIDNCKNGVQTDRTDCRIKNLRGVYIWCRIVISAEFDDENNISFIVATIQDIDKDTKVLKRLKLKAEYDALTGLKNMEKFTNEVMSLFLHPTGKNYALICMDIDKFKVINDILGLDKGDYTLRFVGNILKKEVSKRDILARQNADNFCIMKEYENKREIETFIESVVSDMYAFDLMNDIKLSFGVYPITDTSLPLSIMCDRAILAKDSVKGSKVEHYAFYDDEMRKKMLEDKEIESEMEDALEEHQFEMFLQPKYHITTSTVIGAEALVRWNHPKKGYVMPFRFIPLFEKNGFIIKLDEYMWEEACKALRKWIDTGLKPVPISVNVSRVHILNPKFINIIEGLVEKYNIPKNLLELELTETVFFDDEKKLYEVLSDLQKAGFILEMDDFGSGYSSLKLLKNVPVDVIKIDKDFFNETMSTQRGQTVISHTISMANDLELRMVAEGVETLAQAAFLAECGCPVAQGYYYSKPVRLEEFEKKVYYSEKAVPDDVIKNL